MTKNRRPFLCLDCKQDTGKMGEYYFIRTPLWLSAVGSKKGMLCIGCLEIRLGRELTAADFTSAYINQQHYPMCRSDRLVNRLTTQETTQTTQRNTDGRNSAPRTRTASVHDQRASAE